MGDPLFNNGVDLAVVLIVIVKTLIVFVALLVSVLFMIWYERKVISWMQNRYGPNRAGPYGLLQSLADGIKVFFKEGFRPSRADRPIYRLAPYLSLLPAFIAFAIVPFGGTIRIAHHTTRLQLVDPPWGILLVLMMSSIGVYGVMLAGWASGSKYPLLGSVRASAQMVSYEAAMGLTTATVVLLTGSLRASSIVASQHGSFLVHWNLIRAGVVPFVIFLIAVTAEMNRPPFDLVEAEEEIAGGYMAEYSSVGFALFYLAEFGNVITNSAIIVTLFLGGPDGPRIAGHSIGIVWFLLKVFCFLFIYVWFRATLPRFRYDQLMDLGWKRLIPISLGWLLVVAGFRTNDQWWGLVMFGLVLVAAALVSRALSVGRGASTVEAETEKVA
jgi:NADH-quinone oxidoreductase subunit H